MVYEKSGLRLAFLMFNFYNTRKQRVRGKAGRVKGKTHFTLHIQE